MPTTHQLRNEYEDKGILLAAAQLWDKIANFRNYGQ